MDSLCLLAQSALRYAEQNIVVRRRRQQLAKFLMTSVCETGFQGLLCVLVHPCDPALAVNRNDSFMDPFAAPTEVPQTDPSGWGETDWQRYDWSAAAALGDAGDPAAMSAWAQTDWGNPGSSAKDTRDSAAKAIADALDGIARRIRDGDLVFPPPPASVPDPATIAATLAALLGVRR